MKPSSATARAQTAPACAGTDRSRVPFKPTKAPEKVPEAKAVDSTPQLAGLSEERRAARLARIFRLADKLNACRGVEVQLYYPLKFETYLEYEERVCFRLSELEAKASAAGQTRPVAISLNDDLAEIQAEWCDVCPEWAVTLMWADNCTHGFDARSKNAISSARSIVMNPPKPNVTCTICKRVVPSAEMHCMSCKAIKCASCTSEIIARHNNQRGKFKVCS